MKQAQENTVHHAQLQAMTPEMRQSLAILQMPLPELQAYVTQQLLENCVLEQEDEQEMDVAGESPGGDPGVNHDTSNQAGDLDWLEYFSDGRDLGVRSAGGRRAAWTDRESRGSRPRRRGDPAGLFAFPVPHGLPQRRSGEHR